MVYIVQIIRSSVGDLQTPHYTLWKKHLHNPEMQSLAKLMINLIWSLWIFQILIFMVLLLNFLIAIVAQSYEDTIMKTE
jgi:hypothetical protein